MPRVRVERTPIQGWVGIFGGDHLLVTYEPAPFLDQIHWYGIEGARVIFNGSATPSLGVLGANGTTTLATLNAFDDGNRYRAPDETELANIIGTPQQRGSRALPFVSPDAAWATMASFAGKIDAEAYPYTAVALPFTTNTALNSTSLIASLLHYAGVSLSTNLGIGSASLVLLLRNAGNQIQIRCQHLDNCTTNYGHDGHNT